MIQYKEGSKKNYLFQIKRVYCRDSLFVAKISYFAYKRVENLTKKVENIHPAKRIAIIFRSSYAANKITSMIIQRNRSFLNRLALILRFDP